MLRPTMLLIMDGFGISPLINNNAIALANAPELKNLMSSYPHTTVSASGLDVGLPDGQMGNSEVGHLNIGAGRIIYQELTNITKHIHDGSFFQNHAFLSAISHVLKNDSTLHLFGLVSDGGVHSHIDHLKGLISLAKKSGIKKVYIDGILDGRDVPPRSALQFIRELEDYMRDEGVGRFTTISGRYYAMDRDKRWERVIKAYDAMTLSQGFIAATAEDAVNDAYLRGENDEFVQPAVIGDPIPVRDHDAVIMFNFRPDRAREITRCFTDDAFAGFERKQRPEDIVYVCMCQYDAAMPAVLVAYPPEKIKNTLGEYLSALGLTQLRIAETEKYAHVTFFFNGGIEEPNRNEERILIPSPKVATYDLQPEMSAYLVRDRAITEIKSGKFDVIILNFANADMVGHTGIMEAAVKAIEALNQCVPEICQEVLKAGGQVLLTSDHGNADVMCDEAGMPLTAHSLNPVPLVHIAEDPRELLEGGKLCDIAPTMLDLMGISIPLEMTGRSLVNRIE